MSMEYQEILVVLCLCKQHKQGLDCVFIEMFYLIYIYMLQLATRQRIWPNLRLIDKHYVLKAWQALNWWRGIEP